MEKLGELFHDEGSEELKSRAEQDATLREAYNRLNARLRDVQTLGRHMDSRKLLGLLVRGWGCLRDVCSH